jgi:hypothetical protein
MTDDERQLAMMHRYFYWFEARVLALASHMKAVSVKDHPELTIEELLHRYMLWALSHGMLHVFGDAEDNPHSGVIVRPVDHRRIGWYQEDYYARLCDYDEGGDTAWVDFCFAPGNYPLIISLLVATGCKYTCWEHRTTGKFHLLPIARMPKVTLLSESNHQRQGDLTKEKWRMEMEVSLG